MSYSQFFKVISIVEMQFQTLFNRFSDFQLDFKVLKIRPYITKSWPLKFYQTNLISMIFFFAKFVPPTPPSLRHFLLQGLYLTIYQCKKETLFYDHTYTEYRVFTELKYLNMFSYNSHPKSDNEITSVDAAVYQRVKMNLVILNFNVIMYKK